MKVVLNQFQIIKHHKVLNVKNKIVRGSTTQTLELTIYQGNDTMDSYMVYVHDVTKNNDEINFVLSAIAKFDKTLPFKYNTLINKQPCVELLRYDPSGKMINYPTKTQYEIIVSKRVVDMMRTFSSWTYEKWGFSASVFGFSCYTS